MPRWSCRWGSKEWNMKASLCMIWAVFIEEFQFIDRITFWKICSKMLYLERVMNEGWIYPKSTGWECWPDIYETALRTDPVRGWPENDRHTSALGWRPTERLSLLWEVYCSSKGEMSQAARDSTSGELSYQFVQDETYQSLGLLIIEELVGFKRLLVLRFRLL